MSKKRFSVIAVVAFIASITAILAYFGIQPKSSAKPNSEKTIQITSYNQQGGITAGEINIGIRPRIFSERAYNDLERYLPTDKNKFIDITCVMGDQEGFQFAEQIKQSLIARGWKVRGVSQGIFGKPVVGQLINPSSDGGIRITIGAKER